MKSAGWYFMKGGQRVWAATKREIRKLAQAAADELGAGVTVRPAGQARQVKAKRNPAPASRARPPVPPGWRVLGSGGSYYVEGPGNDGRGIFNRWFDTRAAAEIAIGRHVKRHRYRTNPDPGAMLDVLWERERGRQARASYVARTKGQRMAKHLRNRDPAAAREAAREKTGKFVVKASNRKEAFTLYRASRAAANALARQFEAAGYDVAVREA